MTRMMYLITPEGYRNRRGEVDLYPCRYMRKKSAFSVDCCGRVKPNSCSISFYSRISFFSNSIMSEPNEDEQLSRGGWGPEDERQAFENGRKQFYGEICKLLRRYSDESDSSKWNGQYPNMVKLVIECGYGSRMELSRLNLINVELPGINLTGADLHESDLSMADLTGADLTEANLRGTRLLEAHMEGIILKKADLQGAIIQGSDMPNAILTEADMRKVDLRNTCLKGANLTGADMRGAKITWEQLKAAKNLVKSKFPEISILNDDMSNRDFSGVGLVGVTIENTNLKGAIFRMAQVDGSTLITGDPDKIVDDDTDFTGVGLSAARIDPKLRTRLERNIRKKQWETWYVKPRIYSLHKSLIDKGKKLTAKLFKRNNIENTDIPPNDTSKPEEQYTLTQWLKSIFVDIPTELFWWLSDYGTKSKRCVFAFITLNIVAFFAYFRLTGYTVITSDLWQTLANLGQLAGQTILTMFGMESLQLQVPWMLLIAIHVICGYFLLAVLITRFAIMFQSLSP